MVTDLGDVDQVHKRRAIVYLSITFALPAVVVLIVLLQQHADAPAWVVLAVGYAFVAGLLFFSARSGARSVSRARAAHPEALFIARALDPTVQPRGVRVLVVDAGGLHLATGRSSSKLTWSIPWSSVSGAALSAVTVGVGTTSGVVVLLAGGEVKRLRLPSAFGLSSDLQACQDLVRTVNERAAQTGPAMASEELPCSGS